MIVETKKDVSSFRRQVAIGSVSVWFFKLFGRVLRISHFEAGVKEEKSGGVVGEEGEYGNDVVWLLARDRRCLDILLVKKKSKVVSKKYTWGIGR